MGAKLADICDRVAGKRLAARGESEHVLFNAQFDRLCYPKGVAQLSPALTFTTGG